MRAGLFRHRIVIQQRDSALDAAGQQVLTWTTVCTVYANVQFIAGGEQVKADSNTATVTAKMRIHWRTGIFPSMRVVHDGAYYDIVAINPDKTGRTFLDFDVMTGASVG
jgi:SPP1 family predicted phage head-tail adaptor